MELKLLVKNQELIIESDPCDSVALTQNYIKCIFTFATSDWAGTAKTVLFENSVSNIKRYLILDDTYSCLIPSEILSIGGHVLISVFGVRDNYKITSSIACFYNSDTLYGGEEPSEITPTIYEQILSEMNKKADGLKVEDGALQLTANGVAISSVRIPNISGREVELRNNGTEIQWRYTDENEWFTLVSLSDLQGPPGETPEFEIRDKHLYAIYK